MTKPKPPEDIDHSKQFSGLRAVVYGKLGAKSNDAKHKHAILCAFCGKQAVTLRTSGKYCSLRCRVAYFRRLRRIDPI